MLSQREREVLTLIADGHTSDEIGGLLFLSPHTVKAHTKRVYQRLGVRCAAQAVAVGFREGLLN